MRPAPSLESVAVPKPITGMALRVEEELSTASGILLAVFVAAPSILCGEYGEPTPPNVRRWSENGVCLFYIHVARLSAALYTFIFIFYDHIFFFFLFWIWDHPIYINSTININVYTKYIKKMCTNNTSFYVHVKFLGIYYCLSWTWGVTSSS